jgi:hypothetical protein
LFGCCNQFTGHAKQLTGHITGRITGHITGRIPVTPWSELPVTHNLPVTQNNLPVTPWTLALEGHVASCGTPDQVEATPWAEASQSTGRSYPVDWAIPLHKEASIRTGAPSPRRVLHMDCGNPNPWGGFSTVWGTPNPPEQHQHCFREFRSSIKLAFSKNCNFY